MKNNHSRRAAVLLPLALVLAALLALTAGAADYETVSGQPCALSGSDFLPAYTESIDGIYIHDVPSSADGCFTCGSRTLRTGDVLSDDMLNQIRFCPRSDTVADVTLCYSPIVGSKLGETVQMTVHVKSDKNEPPIAKDSTFETYKNVANDGTLSVVDPENGTLTYTLVSQPKRGSVEISEDGKFLYTPNENKVGKDTFTYTVTDEAGNTSEEAKVSIKILKPSDAATYTDMTEDAEQFEAMWLRTTGLFDGKSLAGNQCFEPDASMSRGEFLVMAMQLAKITPEENDTVSSFSDQSDAPGWMQPYLTCALRSGLVKGIHSEDGLVFHPNAPVTCAQAAVMVQGILNLPNPETQTVFSADTVLPTWASDSVQALSQAGLSLNTADFTNALSRREAAKLLYEVSQLV